MTLMILCRSRMTLSFQVQAQIWNRLTNELRCHPNFHVLCLQLRIVALLNGAKTFLLYNSISDHLLG